MSPELRWVSKGFDNRVKTYEKYDVNGYRFHTIGHQNSRPNAKTINTGVFVGGADQNKTQFYGRLQKIYSLSFRRGAKDLHLVVFKCLWFDPVHGLKSTPDIGLVEVKTASVYAGSDVFVVANQAKQVYYIPYPCQKPSLQGWEVVYQVSPHGKLPVPNDDDYNNINPNTYEGEFYQEQELNGVFDISLNGLDALDEDAQNDGETVVNLKDIDMLAKLHLDDDDEDEIVIADQPLYTRDSDDEDEIDWDFDDDIFG